MRGTVTWDVFKLEFGTSKMLARPCGTVTWDVFKFDTQLTEKQRQVVEP